MVKHFKEDLRRQQICQDEKLQLKAEQLATLHRKDFIRDYKKHCLKNSIPYKKHPMALHDKLFATSDYSARDVKEDVQREVATYKIALQNAENVLGKLHEMHVKNQRPADYLVEMYKSDKQMFKVRRFLSQKESKIKEKMQGKDWLSKTKRRQRAKKKSEAKKARKKAKLQAKRPQMAKPKMDKVNGKNKVKKR